MKPQKDNTFCHYPFKQIAMKNWHGDKLVEYTPCCMMLDHGENMMKWSCADQINPDDAFHSEKFNKLRYDLQNNIKNEACENCWKMERDGLLSPRLYSLENHNEYDTEFFSIDLTLSNKCNLMCRMCNIGNSHKFKKEVNFFKKNNLFDEVLEVTDNYFIEKNLITSTNKSSQLEWVINNTHKIKLLKISGGEPFYDQNVIKILQKYVNDGHCHDTTLQFNTNGTLFTDELIELQSKFKQINHYISFDGVEDIYEYIRHPFSFTEFLKSIRRYNKLKNMRSMNCVMVVSSLNVLNISEWLFYLPIISKTHNFIPTFSKVRPDFRGTSINLLPKYILEEAKNRIINSEYANKFKNRFDSDIKKMLLIIDSAIKNNFPNKEKMKREIKIFDFSREQNYESYLDPMLVEWLS